MQPDQNRQKTVKERGGLSQHRLHPPTKPVITLIRHTIEPGKALKTREAGEDSPFVPVFSALRREYNSHSTRTGGKIVQPVDAAEKSPHNYDAAACAAVLHGNFSADLSVGLNKMHFME